LKKQFKGEIRMAVHKEKMLVPDHSGTARPNETPYQRAERRKGQTDFQNDEEDRALAASADKPQIEGRPAKEVTVTRHKNGPWNRPGEEIAGESAILGTIPPDSTSGNQPAAVLPVSEPEQPQTLVPTEEPLGGNQPGGTQPGGTFGRRGSR